MWFLIFVLDVTTPPCRAMSRDEEYLDLDGFRLGSYFGSDRSLNSHSITNEPMFSWAADAPNEREEIVDFGQVLYEKAKGVDGREIEVKSQFTTGMAIRTGTPFPLRISLFCTEGEVGT